MRSVLSWQVNVPEREGITGVVYDICFNPAGSQIVVGCGNVVLVYDATDGLLLHRLKGHKDVVYCVAYAKDGKRFASGGADKNVIIWKDTGEGMLKFSHNDNIQALAYNPVTLQLASVTASDFGLWSPDQKSVAKHKISAKGTCLSWTNDGQLLAIGQFDGTITIRQKDGSERLSVKRNAPIWSVNFNPTSEEGEDTLAVAAWDGTLSFWSLTGRQLGKDKQLNMDPCSVRYFSNGEYMVMGGSDKKAHLWTREGVQLSQICERDDWIWMVAPRPKHNTVAVGCNDGTVALYQLVFSTVHGLYQDRYAYRDLMSDVIIQHLVTEQKVRIKCRDHVRKIAVYKRRLAVQLPDKVLIYDLKGEEDNDMHYKKRDTILKALDCNLLVVTADHVLLCLERKLQLLNFKGDKEREWVLDAVIRYIKVVGGPPRKEGLLVGLKNGQVLKIFVDNPFPIPVVNHERAIRCLDLSCSRRRLAIVDEAANVVVYDMQTQERLFEDVNANSVAWNSLLEGQLCYTGKDQLSIKTGDFPTHREKMQGFVVGVRGSKVFCLHYLAMNTVNVPQSAAMYRYLEKRQFLEAYKVATMGVTDTDWQTLALEALMAMELEVAVKSFIRVRDIRYIELINRIKSSRKLPGHDDQVFLGEAMALRGMFQEAGRVYSKCGRTDLAIKMFSDLKRWDDARNIAQQAQGMDIKDLTREQAQWALENQEWKTAASIFVTSEEYGKAIDVMGEHGLLDMLIDVVRRLDKSETGLLAKCAATFREKGYAQYAKETYIKMGNTGALMEVYVEAEKWEEAFQLLEQLPDQADKVYLPYARWLAINDRFEEAQQAFRKAGQAEEAVHMLESLAQQAVTINNFKDASYFHFLLAQESCKLYPAASGAEVAEKGRGLFLDYSQSAEVYYAYDMIYTYITQPFTSFQTEAIFNTGRFLLQKVHKDAPAGVSRAYVLWALAEASKKLECYKVGRKALELLSALRVPAGWNDKVDLACLQVRGKPMSDNDEVMGAEGMFSGQRSFLNFDVLPLVEFQLDSAITDEEAAELLADRKSVV